MSAIDTAWYPFPATRSAAAARMRSLRAGSRVRAAPSAWRATAELAAIAPAASRSALCSGLTLKSIRSPSGRCGRRLQQRDGDVGMAAAQGLAGALGLRGGPGGRRDPLAEQADHHEVQRAQVGQLVPAHGQPR